MRFIVLVKANPEYEAGAMPDEKLIIEMGKFNEDLITSGMLHSGEGLHPSSKGARIRFAADGRPTVTEGPFADLAGLVSGFWIINARSKADVVEKFLKCPFEVGEIEIRQVFDTVDFEPAVTTDEGRATLDAEEAFRKRTGL